MAEPLTPDEQKSELLKLLSGVDGEHAKLEVLGLELVRHSRLARDVATPLFEVVQRIPASGLTTSEWGEHVQGWRALQDTTSALLGSSTLVNSFAAVASGAINTTVSGVFFHQPYPAAPSLLPPLPEIAAARTRLFNTLEQFPLADSAKQSMARLGLTVRGVGSRPPIDLLDEALGVMQAPSVPDGRPTSALLPLRECIDASIAEMIRRRIVQEPASKRKDKVVSLGRHCSRPALLPDHFERLGEDAERIANLLSGSKQADHNRERVSELFHNGLLLLKALLESVDEARLRPA